MLVILRWLYNREIDKKKYLRKVSYTVCVNFIKIFTYMFFFSLEVYEHTSTWNKVSAIKKRLIRTYYTR